MPGSLHFSPIGFLHCQETWPYDVPRQGSLAGKNLATITLVPELEHATLELDSFSHVWLLFLFHHNTTWNPMVRPPRHREQKVGVLASRSPYRPNPIGLSCVRLLSVNGREIQIQGHDLLDGTPILDIKPYLPYADAFPDASTGWTSRGDGQIFQIQCAPKATERLGWLEANGVPCIRAFLQDRLSAEPDNPRRNRLTAPGILAYRTWRIPFQVEKGLVTVSSIFSGYSRTELASQEDPYHDKAIHRLFLSIFPDT